MRHNEVDRFLETNPEVVQAFTDAFIARWDTYPYQLPDGSYTRAYAGQGETKTYLPLTTAHIEQHFKGIQTIGAYMLSPTSETQRIVFDDDSEQGLDRLRELAQDMAADGIPAQLERSSRGGHLWIHTPPLTGKDARRVGVYLLAKRGFTTRDIELYPKQNYLHGEHVGSLVRLPLGRHLKTGHFYGFIDLQGHDLADRRRDQLAIISNPQRASQEVIDRILAVAPEQKREFHLDPTRLSRWTDEMPPDEKIKRAVSPIDFISQYVDLDPAGRGLCPFHDDHRQSLKVYDDGWHCFAGCEGNTIIDFYIKWRGFQSLTLSPTDWRQVLKDMLKMLGV